MIRYQMADAGMFPRIFCDACEKPIDTEHGFVFWNHEGNTAHAHQGPCSHKLDLTRVWPFSESLVTFLANLLRNTRINLKTLKPDELWAMFGVVADRKAL